MLTVSTLGIIVHLYFIGTDIEHTLSVIGIGSVPHLVHNLPSFITRLHKPLLVG